MKDRFSQIRLRILAVRIVLGLAFAFLLTSLFLPAAGVMGILVLAGLLTSFAYVFEHVHRTKDP
jgi:hypothetical protein